MQIDPDLEETGDDEPSLGGRGLEDWATESVVDDLEADDSDDEPDLCDEPSLGSLDGKDDQTAWAAGGRCDRELDLAESGIGDADGLHEQVGTQDWQQGSMG